MATKKLMLAEAAKIEKGLGKLKGKKWKTQRNRMYNLRTRVRLLDGKKAKPKASRKKAKHIDPMQGLLPGFIEQMQPTVAEIARTIVFEALRKGIQDNIDELSAPAVVFSKKRKSS